nr:hypothetical protein GCM10025730_02220 [Promicromonospora thailandica]
MLSVGYAVRLLGGRLPYPVRAVHALSGREVVRALEARDWGAGAWGAVPPSTRWPRRAP